MTAQLIDGKAVAASVQARVAAAVAARVAAGKRAPSLATILVGADPASQVYVRNKRLACEKTGIRSIPLEFAPELGEAALLAEIDRLNADPNVDGILVQMPLPAQIDPEKVVERI
ncbi:MAG: bifunctional methylenetetrahydrofolate dehydrogenase/methenyltetrahydrofolate cyclohydrolase, partial [Nevskiaceae bacterium]